MKKKSCERTGDNDLTAQQNDSKSWLRELKLVSPKPQVHDHDDPKGPPFLPTFRRSWRGTKKRLTLYSMAVTMTARQLQGWHVTCDETVCGKNKKKYP